MYIYTYICGCRVLGLGGKKGMYGGNKGIILPHSQLTANMFGWLQTQGYGFGAMLP